MNIKWNPTLSNPGTHSKIPSRSNEKPSHSVFEQTLQEELQKRTVPLKVSKHAAARIEARSLDISRPMWERIGEKVKEAQKKGVNDPLVLTPKVAMIVSAKNETVVTAMSRDEMKDQIFTNIDGTIVLQ